MHGSSVRLFRVICIEIRKFAFV
eukprot:SAG31_NODE_8173_length_1503_cov_1.425926_1_plen_22_part_10